MTATKRPAGEVRFLATKAIVGGLSVATFLGAWRVVAATGASGDSAAEPVPEAGAVQAEAPGPVVERQVIYYIVNPAPGVAAGLPAQQPAASAGAGNTTAQAAAPPAPRPAPPAAKQSRGS